MHHVMRLGLRFVAALSVGIVVASLLYSAASFYLYHRVKPQERPCVDCSAPVHVGGFDLFFREVGLDQGLPPVVLVHGGPGHSSLSFKGSFDFLAARTRVIYYDQRGSGNSQISPSVEDYTVDHLVDELESIRRDVLKSDQIILIGHSFGSALVQRYALKHPDRVSKLVLVCGIRINNSMDSRLVWKWFGPALYSFALGFPPGDAKEADAWMTPKPDDDADRLFDPSRTDLLEGSGTISFATWFSVSQSLAGYDYRHELSQLPVPTLFIYGDADSPYTGKPVADELGGILPVFRSVGFSHSGHWPFLEEPERFQVELSKFLFDR
jgi:proline iminopeptidase